MCRLSDLQRLPTNLKHIDILIFQLTFSQLTSYVDVNFFGRKARSDHGLHVRPLMPTPFRSVISSSRRLINYACVCVRGGIGKATAHALARRGCSIAVHYNSAEDVASSLVTELEAFSGVRAAAFQADLRDYDNVRRLHSEVVDKMGHPDILYNNAAVPGKTIGAKGDLQDMSVEEFERTWKMNTGSSYLVRIVMPVFLNFSSKTRGN